jgi:uncharacterized membrane protein
MIGWHFPLLLFAAFLPYATATMGHSRDNPLAALLFGVVVLLLLVSRSLMQTLAYRDDALLAEVDRQSFRERLRAGWAVDAYWAATLLFVWWTPWVQLAWFASGPVAILTTSLIRRERGRAQAAGQEGSAS